MDGLVPSGSFEVHSVAEHSVCWLLCDILRVDLVVNLKVIVELIDGDCVLSCVVLQSASEEGLREEETGDPVGSWHTHIDPGGDEVHPFCQVVDPRRQWLEGQETDFSEGSRHLVVKQ